MSRSIAAARPELGRAPSDFRRDIEGLRAVAVLAVMLFHAEVPYMTGGYVGVDVFFVLSGFLITGILLKELESTGRISLRRFYARRTRRLLPASALALVGTVVLTRLYLPITRWFDIGGDIVSSATYLINWRLAGRAVDYWAAESAASPVQHFWSLAVEEQFYLIWPISAALLAGLARLLTRSARSTLCIGILSVLVASIIWSTYYTNESPGQAYFVTTTRVWELAAGALLATGIAQKTITLSLRLATTMVIGGLALIAYSVVTYSSATSFPGLAATVPVVGTLLVLVAGTSDESHALAGALGSPVSLWLGARSYSLYLWHWPVLVVAQTRIAEYSPWHGVAALIVSIVPAAMSYRLVENPIRHLGHLERPRTALAMAAALTALGAAAGIWLQSQI